jgi:hypothetical protein
MLITSDKGFADIPRAAPDPLPLSVGATGGSRESSSRKNVPIGAKWTGRPP